MKNTEKHIPKVIHYCWFGGNPLPDLAEKCIASWKKYLPDYEIKQWDESNFNVNSIPYTAQAYESKKYAFVSDYARFWILYNYGGLYFDTDVEVIKPFDDIISSGAFMGCENQYKKDGSPIELGVNPGLGVGAYPAMDLYKEILESYSTLKFKNPDGSMNMKTVVQYTTELLCKKGLRNSPHKQTVAGIDIYPRDFFSPKSFDSGKINISPATRSIHHFSMSWMSSRAKTGVAAERILTSLFGTRFVGRLKNLYYRFIYPILTKN